MVKHPAWIALALVMAAFAACANSDRLCDVEPDYPDISGLVVFYQFDGNLRNAVADIHHGSEGGAVQYVPDHRGIANSAVSVDGDTIRIADHPDLDITGAITIAAWVKPEVSERHFVAVADKFFLRAYSFGLDGAAGRDTVSVIAFIAGQPFSSDRVVPFATGTWTHIAFTYDEGLEEGKFYVNGLPAGSVFHRVRIGRNTMDLQIGVTMFDYAYRGAIDQLAIFDRALTAAEVHCLYAFE
jgi:hypothetical protein